MKNKLSAKARYYPLYPDFPKTGYMLFLFMLLEGRPYGLLHLSSVYPDMQFLREAIPPTVNYFIQTGAKDDISIADEGLLMPLRFLRIIPLSKRAQVPTIDCRNYRFAMQSFLPVGQHPTDFEMLVLPNEHFAREGWLYSTAMPFKKPVDQQLLETYLTQANYPISRHAKKAAIYQIGPAVGYEWETGELRELAAPEAVKDEPVQ